MKITETHQSQDPAIKYIFEYQDVDSFEQLEYQKCQQVYGVCFCGGQLVIGYGGRKKDWGLIGGRIEEGETYEQTLRREIQEESNMRILSLKPIGYQKVINPTDDGFVYQLRYACFVEPVGPFVSDPAGMVTEIKLIDPAEYKNYFDWGKIGERIISRAREIMGV